MCSQLQLRRIRRPGQARENTWFYQARDKKTAAFQNVGNTRHSLEREKQLTCF